MDLSIAQYIMLYTKCNGNKLIIGIENGFKKCI